MKDLRQLASACEAELRAIGIRPGRVAVWKVNSRAKSRWGQCRELSPGCFGAANAAANFPASGKAASCSTRSATAAASAAAGSSGCAERSISR